MASELYKWLTRNELDDQIPKVYEPGIRDKLIDQLTPEQMASYTNNPAAQDYGVRSAGLGYGQHFDIGNEETGGEDVPNEVNDLQEQSELAKFQARMRGPR